MSEERYNVVCGRCGSVWSPGVRTSLWWKAKQYADAGHFNAIAVSGVECGCEQPVRDPDAPYRVVGYDDMCVDFNIPFHSVVEAARTYLQIARDGMSVVSFVDRRTAGTPRQTRVQQRLRELEWA